MRVRSISYNPLKIQAASVDPPAQSRYFGALQIPGRACIAHLNLKWRCRDFVGRGAYLFHWVTGIIPCIRVSKITSDGRCQKPIRYRRCSSRSLVKLTRAVMGFLWVREASFFFTRELFFLFNLMFCYVGFVCFCRAMRWIFFFFFRCIATFWKSRAFEDF